MPHKILFPLLEYIVAIVNEMKKAKVRQMRQIKCESSTAFKGSNHALLEVVVLLVDYVDLIALALGVCLVPILFFLLCISFPSHRNMVTFFFVTLKALPLSHFYLSNVEHFYVFYFLHPPY